jgi:hypothetical protein
MSNNDDERRSTAEGRRQAENEVWLQVLRNRAAEHETARRVARGLDGLREALKKPGDPGTIPEAYPDPDPARRKKPVLMKVDRIAARPGRWTASGENFSPDSRVVFRYGDRVVEFRTVLVGPGQLEFEAPHDLPAGADFEVTDEDVPGAEREQSERMLRQEPVLKSVDRETEPGRWTASGENFTPNTRVVLKYGDLVVGLPTVLVAPDELEFEAPHDLPAEAEFGVTDEDVSEAEREELERLLRTRPKKRNKEE